MVFLSSIVNTKILSFLSGLYAKKMVFIRYYFSPNSTAFETITKNMNMYQSKNNAIVEGNPKSSLSIATTPRCREGTAPFPGLLHSVLINTLKCRVLSKEASSTIFWVFGMTQPGIEPGFPRLLANTLLTMQFYFALQSQVDCTNPVGRKTSLREKRGKYLKSLIQMW